MSGSSSDTDWLLVGASGRVGRLVAAAWDASPRPARLLRQLRRGGASRGSLTWSPLEGAGPLLEHVAEGRRIGAMIVLAGIVPGRAQADFTDDARIVDACLAAAAAAGVPRCLVASSAAVYGAWRGHPFREDDIPRPAAPYGRGKLASEDVCREWAARGLAVSALRIGNVAGADALLGQDDTRLARGLRLDRFGDGSGPVRSYIDPPTLADVLCSLAQADALPATVNVAIPEEVAMADLLTAAGLRWEWTQAPEGAARRVVLDCGLLATIHRFAPDAAEPGRIVAGWRAAQAAA